jgi:hypothetical protein
MWEDPIVAEVDRAREMLAAKFNFHVEAIFADIRKRQAALGARLVPQRTRTETKTDAGGGRRSGSAESTSSDAAPAAELGLPLLTGRMDEFIWLPGRTSHPSRRFGRCQ